MNKNMSILVFAIGFFLRGYSQTVSDGEYFIQVNTTKKYIAIEGISQDNGAKLVQWDFANNPNHKFIIKNIGNNLYTFKAVHSGKYLSLEGTLGQQGAKIIQWDWVNQDNQKWFISPSSKNPGSFAINTAAGLKRIRLTGNYGNPANGAYFILNDEEPANYFTFRKNEVEPSGSILKTQSKITTVQGNSATKLLADVQDGIYKIRINESGKYLAIAGNDDLNNGARLIQWDMLPRNNHLFKITRLDNGNYSIAAVHSRKVLDVVDRRTDDGTQIQQWDNLNGGNQQWKFYGEKGALSIISVASQKKLQLSSGINNTNNGTSIILASGAAQTFTLLPAREIPYNDVITISNLKLTIPKNGDADIFGKVAVILYNKNGNKIWDFGKNDLLMFKKQEEAIDLNKQVASFNKVISYKIPSSRRDEVMGGYIIINYGLNENDGDLISLPNYSASSLDEAMRAGGADDFYFLKQPLDNCLKRKYSAYSVKIELHDVPPHCQVHDWLQDEDGSDNYIDAYFTITRERK